jgi:hypothetical protein
MFAVTTLSAICPCPRAPSRRAARTATDTVRATCLTCPDGTTAHRRGKCVAYGSACHTRPSKPNCTPAWCASTSAAVDHAISNVTDNAIKWNPPTPSSVNWRLTSSLRTGQVPSPLKLPGSAIPPPGWAGVSRTRDGETAVAGRPGCGRPGPRGCSQSRHAPARDAPCSDPRSNVTLSYRP